jgi:hypothetical protein
VLSKEPERKAMEKGKHGESLEEIPLPGGRLTPGIVRVGNTVRRPPKGNAAFVHALLLFLRGAGLSLRVALFGDG